MSCRQKLSIMHLRKRKLDIEDLKRLIEICSKPDLSLEEKISIYYCYPNVEGAISSVLRRSKNFDKEFSKFVIKKTSKRAKYGIELNKDSDNPVELYVLYANIVLKIHDELTAQYDDYLSELVDTNTK